MHAHRYTHVSELYDLVYEGRTGDVAFYTGVMEQAVSEGAARVLEVGAGTGRVLLPLAARYPQVTFTALDIDRDELDVLATAAQLRGLTHVRTVQGDVLDLAASSDFDLVTAPFRVLQHCLTLDDLAAAFSRIHDALRPGGTFVFDVFNPSVSALTRNGHIVTEEFVDADGVQIRRDVEINRRDLFAQTQHIEEYYVVTSPDGTSHELSWTYETRYHFRGEVEPLLRAAGLTVESVHGDFEGREFGAASYPGNLVFRTSRPL